MTGNGTEQPKGPPFRLDRQSGEVVLTDHNGRERRLRPTMAAAEQIESSLGAGMDVLRTRVAAACWPYAPHVAAEPKMVPTGNELAVILHAGLQASGERTATLDEAKNIIWKMGRAKIVGALLEFTWAAADGGRLREEDLKNEDSPNDSKSEPNGVAKDEVIDQLTLDLTTGLHSGSS